jgi:hypothetical protein
MPKKELSWQLRLGEPLNYILFEVFMSASNVPSRNNKEQNATFLRTKSTSGR